MNNKRYLTVAALAAVLSAGFILPGQASAHEGNKFAPSEQNRDHGKGHRDGHPGRGHAYGHDKHRHDRHHDNRHHHRYPPVRYIERHRHHGPVHRYYGHHHRGHYERGPDGTLRLILDYPLYW